MSCGRGQKVDETAFSRKGGVGVPVFRDKDGILPFQLDASLDGLGDPNQVLLELRFHSGGEQRSFSHVWLVNV